MLKITNAGFNRGWDNLKKIKPAKDHACEVINIHYALRETIGPKNNAEIIWDLLNGKGLKSHTKKIASALMTKKDNLSTKAQNGLNSIKDIVLYFKEKRRI